MTAGEATANGGCHPGEPGEAAPARRRSAERLEGTIDPGVAGRSARRQYEQRVAERRTRLRQRHPCLARLLLALTGDPLPIRVWAIGAAAEQVVGRHLDALAGRGVVALHDRRVPGRSANIDHIAVGPAGVFVIDTKHRAGSRVRVRRRRRWAAPGPPLLLIDGRDVTALVHGMQWQLATVHRVLAGTDGAVPLSAVVALVGVNHPPIARPLAVDGVAVATSPRSLRRLVGAAGPLRPAAVHDVARRIASALPPA